MGTRADFYVGQGKNAEWLGSIAWDGYPTGEPREVIKATSEQQFRNEVAALLASTDHGTRPEQGWPWPWETSHTTDYAYAFVDGRVMASNFGYEWFDPRVERSEEDIDNAKRLPDDAFPNMLSRQVVTFGARSGMLVLWIPR